MKVRPDLLPYVKERVEMRQRGGDEKYMHGAERVDIFHVEHERFQCKVRKFEFFVDEPPERGGTDQAPNPLAYFLAAAGSCYLMHCARLAMVNGLEIDALSATVLGRFNRRLGGGFTEIVFDLRVEGRESVDEVVNLAKTAQQLCYAHNTLSKAAKVTTNVFVNGERIPLSQP